MRVSLREFKEEDLARLHQWAERIGSGRFMSRYMPKGRDFSEASDAVLLWSVILVEGVDAGVVWLERAAQSDVAVLGILLSNSERFGQGIGTEAIGLAIEQLRGASWSGAVTLNVRQSNSRAIACYRKCGFRVVGDDIRCARGSTFRYLVMERRIPGANAP